MGKQTIGRREAAPPGSARADLMAQPEIINGMAADQAGIAAVLVRPIASAYFK